MEKAISTRMLSIVQGHIPEVLHVQDAKKTILVHVTKKDLAAKVKDHKACVLARACKRDLGVDAALISRSRVFLVRGATATRYTISNATQQEIVAFDRGGEFMPGTYRLNPPYGSKKLGHPRPGEREGKKDGSRPKRTYRFTPGIRVGLATAK